MSLLISKSELYLCRFCAVRNIEGLLQDCSNSSALAMELLYSYTKTSICCIELHFNETSL